VIDPLRRSASVIVCAVLLVASAGFAGDWPQWRGPNRDGKSDFKAPAVWPAQLTQRWKVTVGEGDSTPSLAGDRLYVFSREEGEEVVRCLNAADGGQIWRSAYSQAAIVGPDAREHAGPRATPAVADGKVVTLGVSGVLSCFDAATGQLAWRKDEYSRSWPRFHTASSPIIFDGMVVAQLGGSNDGVVVAFDLGSGDEKWKWSGECPGYASPVLTSVDGLKVLLMQSERSMLAIGAADGRLLWQVPFAPQGMGYNAATPVVNGPIVYYAGQGRGVRAVRLERSGDTLAARELWSNTENSVQFNTPVLKDGLLYGITQSGQFFCINAETGRTAWSAPVGGGAGRGMGLAPVVDRPILAAERGGRGGGGMGGGSAYGSLVDGGSVLLAVTPASQLIVFRPGEQGYNEVARIRVADTPVYAHLIAVDSRIIVKDRDSVTLWVVE